MPLLVPTSHPGVPVRVLADLFLIQFFDKQQLMDQEFGALSAVGEAQMEFHAPGFWPNPAPAIAAIVDKRSLSLPVSLTLWQ